MRYDDITIMILSTTALFAVVTGFIIYFVMLYSNKQKKNKQEQVALQSAFQQELLKTQIEIRSKRLLISAVKSMIILHRFFLL